MDLERIEKLMRMLEQSDLQELDVNDGTVRIRLAKRRTLGLEDAGAVIADAGPGEPEAVGSHRVLSGMTGTFYRSSAPGIAPYVEVGARIEDGQRLGLIEAMKTFNPVESDAAGVVLAILVEDGAAVVAGTALFEIETA